MPAGSLNPDSRSSVFFTRSGGFTSPCWSSMKVAAASVGATTAPSSRASRSGMPRSRCMPRPTMAAVISTPGSASESAGMPAARSTPRSVSSPPANRITASATLPISKASGKSLNTIRPGPSSPASMPTASTISSSGAPDRRATGKRARLTRISRLMRNSARYMLGLAHGFSGGESLSLYTDCGRNGQAWSDLSDPIAAPRRLGA